MAQISVHGGGGDDFEDEDGGAGAGQVHVNPLDSILEEIDIVLEQNAESFVQGFVQKGGQ